MNRNEETRNWYDKSYASAGFGAQRRFPNEELCRFMGRNFFCIPDEQRQNVRILEVGCGSGANLWMVAKEGFDAFGLDISKDSLALAELMLRKYSCSAHLQVGDMTALEFDPDYFDAVLDVFSSNCLTEADGIRFLESVHRVLKPGGKFFSYFPGKKSDAFLNHAPSGKLDESTLDGIRRLDSPFFGNFYPFRFMSCKQYRALLEGLGFEVRYLETTSRTYAFGKESFEFISLEALKR